MNITTFYVIERLSTRYKPYMTRDFYGVLFTSEAKAREAILEVAIGDHWHRDRYRVVTLQEAAQ